MIYLHYTDLHIFFCHRQLYYFVNFDMGLVNIWGAQMTELIVKTPNSGLILDFFCVISTPDTDCSMCRLVSLNTRLDLL